MFIDQDFEAITEGYKNIWKVIYCVENKHFMIFSTFTLLRKPLIFIILRVEQQKMLITFLHPMQIY